MRNSLNKLRREDSYHGEGPVDLGTGRGQRHFVNLRPFVCGLEAGGHKVFVALRHLSNGPNLLGGKAVSYLQAPYKSNVPRNVISMARTFAHILHNIGFGDAAELAALVDAWRSLIDWIGPDLIIFDHSPTALLAARGGKARRVLVGDSFCCPPDCTPFPDLRPWLPADRAALFTTEEIVLENTNRVLRLRGQPVLERWGSFTARWMRSSSRPWRISTTIPTAPLPATAALGCRGRGIAGVARQKRQKGLRLSEELSRLAAIARPLATDRLPDDHARRRRNGGVPTTA